MLKKKKKARCNGNPVHISQHGGILVQESRGEGGDQAYLNTPFCNSWECQVAVTSEDVAKWWPFFGVLPGVFVVCTRLPFYYAFGTLDVRCRTNKLGEV